MKLDFHDLVVIHFRALYKKLEKKKKIQKNWKILEENKKIYISKKNILERWRNYWRLVKEDQNIQDWKN